MSNSLFASDAEVAVLSILLKHRDAIYSINGLRYFMFSSSNHQTLFMEMEEFAEASSTIDVSIITASLESKGKLEKAGNKKYLQFLIDQQYDLNNFKSYVGIVMASFKARSLVEVTSAVKAEDLNFDNIDGTIYQVKQDLDSMLEHVGTSSTLHIKETTKTTYDEIVSRTKNPGARGNTWGVKAIDNITGGKSGGEFWIISGRPSQGKSAMMFNSALADAKAGVPCLIFEKEMRPQEVVERLIAIETGIPITNLRTGTLSQKQLQEVHDSLAVIDCYPMYIDNSYVNSDLYYLESTINKFKRLHDIQNVYVDYLQLYSDRGEGQTAELGRISRLLKLIANDLDICTIAFSQLNRGVESRDNKRPIMSDLRQSGNLEEDADFVVGLYRDEYYNKNTPYKGLMEFIIQKARNGPVGTVTLKFEAETNRINDLK